jgi:lysophospholipase L1-like esterase
MAKRVLVIVVVSFLISCMVSGTTYAHHDYDDWSNDTASSATNATQTDQTDADGLPTTGLYFALGDSIAAGAGLPLYGDAEGDDNACRRSPESYPALIAADRNLVYVQVACSGATSHDVFSQLDEAYREGTPSVVTITVGANDLNWIDYLKQCYSSNCATAANTAAVQSRLGSLQTNLESILQDIEDRSSGDVPQVILTGYSNPVSNYCIGRQNYASKDEIKWLNARRDELNKTIRAAVDKYDFASYASVNFDNHALCATDSWVQQLSDPAPLHPTAQGQRHIADSILSAIN